MFLLFVIFFAQHFHFDRGPVAGNKKFLWKKTRSEIIKHHKLDANQQTSQTWCKPILSTQGPWLNISDLLTLIIVHDSE